MKKLLLILSFLLLPHSAFAAIAFDNSEWDNGLGGQKYKFTTAAAATSTTNLVVLFVENNQATDVCTTGDINGTSLTELSNQQHLTGIGWVYMYYVTGVGGTITATMNGCTVNQVNMAYVSYTGVKATGQPDGGSAFTGQTTGSPVTTLTTNVTTVNNNSWEISFEANAAFSGVTASTNVTARQTKYSGYGIGDSNGPIAAGTNYGMTWTNGSGVVSQLQASFQPDTGGGNTAAPPPLVQVIFSLIPPIREIVTV